MAAKRLPLPTRRALLACGAVAAAAASAYAVARESSMFAVRTIQVRGAPRAVAAEVESALASYRGRSLVGLDGAALERRVESLPTVFAVSYDRAFPDTLRLFVRAEHPVAVLRRGDSSWLVSARGRVIQPLRTRALPNLPRLWVPTSTAVTRGGVLAPSAAGAAHALGLLARDGFPDRATSATVQRDGVTLQLRSGLVVRLGEPDDLDLKLAVARRLVPLVQQYRYLDVSVPGRPVAGTNARLSG